MDIKDFARELIKRAMAEEETPKACKDRERRRQGRGPLLETNDQFNPIGYNIKQRVY